VERFDRDTVRSRLDYERLLDGFAERRIDVLVGTQMIAKGHDFPWVTLVGVVSVDAGLALPDFRATERTFQLLTQVAGRAGRGERPGRVIVQTYHPGNEAIRLAATQDYRSFFERESRIRRLMLYPPFAAMANIVVSAGRRDVARSAAEKIAERLRAAGDRRLRLLGPALAPIERVRYRWRAQVVVRSPSRAVLRRALEAAAAGSDGPPRGVTVDIDVDPVHLL
jgi:primosomal protein N' (replication factor Y)